MIKLLVCFDCFSIVRRALFVQLLQVLVLWEQPGLCGIRRIYTRDTNSSSLDSYGSTTKGGNFCLFSLFCFVIVLFFIIDLGLLSGEALCNTARKHIAYSRGESTGSQKDVNIVHVIANFQSCATCDASQRFASTSPNIGRTSETCVFQVLSHGDVTKH